MHTHEYLKKLFNDYTEEVDKNFFKDIIPTLYGVVSKISYARESAITSFTKIEDIKKIEYEKIEQITGIGQNIQGNITRMIGIVAGGSVGFLTAPDSSVGLELPAYALLGITIGYSIMEIGLRIYKYHKQKEYTENITIKKIIVGMKDSR